MYVRCIALMSCLFLVGGCKSETDGDASADDGHGVEKSDGEHEPRRDEAERGANRDAALVQIQVLLQACQFYFEDTAQYPSSLGDLVRPPASLPAVKWRGPYLDRSSAPRDPWGAEFSFTILAESNGGHAIVISSAGKDGELGTDDDVIGRTEENPND